MFRLGLGLLALSTLVFLLLFTIPFWPVSTGRKALYGGIGFVVGEVTWWLGTALVGPALFVRYKKYLKIPKWLRPSPPARIRSARHRVFVRRAAVQKRGYPFFLRRESRYNRA